LVVLKFAIGSMKAARFATESVATGCSAPSEGSVFSLVSGWQPARLRGVSRLLSLDRAFQNNHAGGHFRFQVVFAAHKDVESLIRRGSFEAALQVFIHAQNAQQFRGFASSLNPDKVCLLGRCQLLRGRQVLHLDFHLGVAVAVGAGDDLAFCAWRYSGIDQTVFASPGDCREKETNQQETSNLSVVHNPSPRSSEASSIDSY